MARIDGKKLGPQFTVRTENSANKRYLLISKISQQLETETIIYTKNEAKYKVRSLWESLTHDVRRVPKVISSNFLWIDLDVPISKSRKGFLEKQNLPWF